MRDSSGVECRLTIPELLLIFEVVRHLKGHAVVAQLPTNSSSPPVLGGASGTGVVGDLAVVVVVMISNGKCPNVGG